MKESARNARDWYLFHLLYNCKIFEKRFGNKSEICDIKCLCLYKDTNFLANHNALALMYGLSSSVYASAKKIRAFVLIQSIKCTSADNVLVPPWRSSGVLMRMSQSTTKNVSDLLERITFSSCISLR